MWQGNRWLLWPELSGAVNSRLFKWSVWVQYTIGRNLLALCRSTQTKTNWGCSVQLENVIKTLNHSQSILSIMLHLCFLGEIWLIKWLAKGLFVICMATCLLDWPDLQDWTHLKRKFPATSLSFTSHCLKNWPANTVIKVFKSMSVFFGVAWRSQHLLLTSNLSKRTTCRLWFDKELLGLALFCFFFFWWNQNKLTSEIYCADFSVSRFRT